MKYLELRQKKAHLLANCYQTIKAGDLFKLDRFRSKSNIMTLNDVKYGHFIIELRPKLQSANVIVCLEDLLPDGDCKVIYDGKHFVVTVGTKKFKIPFGDEFVVPDQIGLINVNEKFISFKYFTKNRIFGTFTSELLQLQTDSKTNYNDIEIEIKQNVRYTLQCCTCRTSVSEPISFDKVLPLPSGNLEADNWFCHGGNMSTKAKLDPTESDLFYAYSYIHLNAKLFRNVITSTTISCKYCSSWLGVALSTNCFRIWSNTISFSCDNNKCFKTNSLKDCYRTIESLLKDSAFGTSKMILHCQLSKAEDNYILLWVLEKNLKVILGDQDEYCDKFVCKVLFKFLSTCDDLVNQWASDVLTPTVQVSKCMMSELKNSLDKMHSLLPTMYSISNNFNVSYISLYSS